MRIAILSGALLAVAMAGRVVAQPIEQSAGAKAWIQCRACHNLAAGAPHKLGPNLHGIIGQPAGSRAGFTYSPALKTSGLVWDRATLDRWIERPSAVLKGHRMVFIGIADPARRAALIEYLASEGGG
ncbi:c-type cytochrome [Polymorphobacter sp.]|uniref:c-type cytochrome n=1 Tax=Polymorphobacter sp. TaxID=1909290 RepID=UPI003F6F47BE